MTTKNENYDWDLEFIKIKERKKKSDYNNACINKCFFIKKEAFYKMMGVYRSVYREGYDIPIAQYIDNKGKEYYRFFGTKDEYLEFKRHFWEPEWDNYFYY